MKIVLGLSSLARYPDGGGHWTWFLQYALGLKALGHEVFVLDVMPGAEEAEERRRAEGFFARMREYGLGERCAVLAAGKTVDVQDPGAGRVYGRSRRELEEIAREAELMWNLGCAIRAPLLTRFRHRVLVDVDPGHLQISALSWDMGIDQHHGFLSVGRKIHDAECGVPTLGVKWQGFAPFVYLPMWQAQPDPGPAAPFTSVTHWTWEELEYQGRMVSVSKRAAYLRYLELPRRTGRPFHLAAYILAEDRTGDRELLESQGWRVLDPRVVVGTPEDYRRFIADSRAEIQCPKPAYRELKTGWFSDRSACYLASGRPVLAEDTGFGEHLPTGEGLVKFGNLEEAAEGVARIDREWERHSRAARRIAQQFLDSRKWLEEMIAASGV